MIFQQTLKLCPNRYDPNVQFPSLTLNRRQAHGTRPSFNSCHARSKTRQNHPAFTPIYVLLNPVPLVLTDLESAFSPPTSPCTPTRRCDTTPSVVSDPARLSPILAMIEDAVNRHTNQRPIIMVATNGSPIPLYRADTRI